MGEETESDYRPSGFERIRSLQWLHRIVAKRRVEEAIREDHLQTDDPGISKALESGIAWLKRAQDCSHSKDGGVARHYSLINGWSGSYPETSGYIIETLIRYGHLFKDDDALYRARRISDWLCSIQLDCGAFQGGTVDQKPVVPVVFNTGQIVIGLAAACRDDAKYADALHRAASWLVSVQDADGAWRQFPSPFAASDAKTYQAHVAWGLLEASRVLKDEQFAATAVRNIDWTITQQRPNGWLERNCVTDDANPLTHTLAYSLRGLVEAYRYTGQASHLDASIALANGMRSALQEDGFLPGRLSSDWQPAVRWSCLTGSVQTAICWFLLYEITGEASYRDAAAAANAFVRKTLAIDDQSGDIRGGVNGSYPIDGDYGRLQYLSWATKFCVDSNILESSVAG